MPPKRKAPAPSSKEGNDGTSEVVKRGRSKAAVSSEPEHDEAGAAPASPVPVRKSGRKPKEVLPEKATSKEKPAPKEKAVAPKAKKEKSASKTNSVPKVNALAKNEGDEKEVIKGEEEDGVPLKSTTPAKSVIIEHCKQCNAFKTRALHVQQYLQNAVPGLEVVINPEKPRRGCFEIRDSEGNIFVSLLGMPRPFAKMKALDMDETAASIVEQLK